MDTNARIWALCVDMHVLLDKLLSVDRVSGYKIMDNEAYRLGLNSYVRNRGRYINPYSRSDSRHNDFERGWSQALKRLPESVINETTRQNFLEEQEELREKKREAERVKEAYLRKKG